MVESVRVSVIILAFNRREYLRAAVASALDQTLPRDQYEILAFKNFEDAELDAYLRENGVRNFTSEPTARPRTMRTVLEEARADILCFLDDDDIFLREKLASVDREFSDDPTLGYYHNGFQVVDDELKPFDRAPFHQPGRRMLLPAGDWGARSLPSNALRLGFNTSSVSVRRDWLGPFLPSFESREAEWSDAMMLACALISGRGVLVDPTVLTQYRYHDSWTNILHYTPDSVGPIADLDGLNIAVLELIGRLAVGTTLAPLVVDDLEYVRFHRSLFVDPPDWRPRAQDFVRFLIGSLQQQNFAPLYLIPLHVWARFSPLGARRAYFRLAAGQRRYSFRKATVS